MFEKLGADGQALDAEEAIKMAEGFILEKEKNTLSPVWIGFFFKKYNLIDCWCRHVENIGMAYRNFILI